jgi:hypothetical protein
MTAPTETPALQYLRHFAIKTTDAERQCSTRAPLAWEAQFEKAFADAVRTLNTEGHTAILWVDPYGTVSADFYPSRTAVDRAAYSYKNGRKVIAAPWK